jgi:integrase
MTRIRLSYVKEYVDRHGKVRRYFRRPGCKPVALPGQPGSKQFMETYQAALDGRFEIGAATARPGSVSALVAAYYASAAYRTLAPLTKSTYRNEIEKFRREHGDKRVAQIERRHVKRMVADKAERPGAANKLLRILKMLMRFAVDEEIRRDDPTAGLKRLTIKGGGFRAWEEEHIGAFEAKHPVGSRARLAIALLLYTAQRRGDVVRMGWQHVRGDKMAVKQQKTGAALWIHIHPELQLVLAATPKANMTFLMTSQGKPFTPPGFGNWFADCCRDAGLPKGFNAHGLRKAAARRLAEAGCTSKEIMAVTGHRSIEEVERYTEAADQVALNEKAIARLGTKGERAVSNLVSNPGIVIK